MPILLLTGFEPFAGGSVNPSADVARALDGKMIGCWSVRSATLPVSFARAWPELAAALDRFEPQCAVALGQAAGRAALALERIARNIDSSFLPDNDGAVRPRAAVLDQGAPYYDATVPVDAMVLASRTAGIPACLSDDAGTFVCNHVFYRLCHAATLAGGRFSAGFIHLPALPSQTAGKPELPSMALATMLAGVAAAIAAIDPPMRTGAPHPPATG